MPHVNSESPDESVHPCSLIWTCFVHRHTTVAIDSVSGQQCPRTACANVQADQGLCYPQKR